MTSDKENMSIAVIANDIGYIKKSIQSIEDRFKDIDNKYVRKDEALKEHQKFEEAIENLSKIVQEHDRFQIQVKTWGAAAVLVLGIVQFLIAKFL